MVWPGPPVCPPAWPRQTQPGVHRNPPLVFGEFLEGGIIYVSEANLSIYPADNRYWDPMLSSGRYEGEEKKENSWR